VFIEILLEPFFFVVCNTVSVNNERVRRNKTTYFAVPIICTRTLAPLRYCFIQTRPGSGCDRSFLSVLLLLVPRFRIMYRAAVSNNEPYSFTAYGAVKVPAPIYVVYARANTTLRSGFVRTWVGDAIHHLLLVQSLSTTYPNTKAASPSTAGAAMAGVATRHVSNPQVMQYSLTVGHALSQCVASQTALIETCAPTLDVVVLPALGAWHAAPCAAVAISSFGQLPTYLHVRLLFVQVFILGFKKALDVLQPHDGRLIGETRAIAGYLHGGFVRLSGAVAYRNAHNLAPRNESNNCD
jgi:hypothetical protein